ncbi:MAG: hypothetical protein M3N54_08735 [Acidobacteriota bacterium]|nr:hypothetical protein [Acidobacteriota bacterium]
MPALNIAMRFVHIFSAITLLGSVLAWRLAVIPATAALAAETRSKVGDAIASRWRPFIICAVAGLLISGLYNFLRKTGLTPAYHAIIGIKILLALHVFAVAILACRAGNPKRDRQLTGVVISGFIIVALSAVLRGLLIP